MAVSSRWTLDSESDVGLREMARYGELVAVYRLPAGVFADSLLFRSGVEGQTLANPLWIDARTGRAARHEGQVSVGDPPGDRPP